MKIGKAAAILVVVGAGFTSGVRAAESQNTAAEFHVEVSRVYGFQPHTLTSEQTTKKSAELDAFWDKVKTDQGRYLPLLRSELQDSSNPSFFLYDGSHLLLSLSETKEDKLLALGAMPHCDMRDVQEKDYLLTFGHFAIEGLDTTDAAFHILDAPKFTVSVPEHALTLGQDYALVYMLLPTEEKYYLNRCVARLSSEKDETAQKSLLLVLWYTVTPEGDAAITQHAADDGAPTAVRAYAKQLQEKAVEMAKEGKRAKALFKELSPPVSSDSDFAQLKVIRRQRLNRLSDEALIELDQLTALMRLKQATKK